jgi:hypothetical protein
MSNPPPLPEPFNPGNPAPVIAYATPAQYYVPVGVCREGNLVVLPKNFSTLPQRCVKCNGEVSGPYHWNKTLYWHNPALYIMILFPGLLIYAIVAIIVRKSAKVDASLCEHHGRQRGNRILTGWLIAVGGIASIIAAIYFGNLPNSDPTQILGPILGWLGGLMILFSLFWAIFAVRVLRPQKIDDRFAWLAGAGPEFLDSLPQTGQYPR